MEAIYEMKFRMERTFGSREIASRTSREMKFYMRSIIQISLYNASHIKFLLFKRNLLVNTLFDICKELIS